MAPGGPTASSRIAVLLGRRQSRRRRNSEELVEVSCKHDWLLRADKRFRAPCPSGLENRKRALRSLDAALCLLWVTAGVERGRQQSLLARTRARLHVIVERYWWCLSLPASDASGLPYDAPKKDIRRLSSCVAAGVLTYHLSKSPNFRPRQAASRSSCSKAKLCPSRRLSIGPTRLCGCSVRSVS